MGGREGQLPGLLPDLRVGRRGHDSTTLAAEQPAILGNAELLDVLPKNPNQLGWNGHRAGIVAAPVLEPAFLVGVAGVSPPEVDLRPGDIHEDAAPAGCRKMTVLLSERHRLAGAEGGVVHAGEHGLKPTLAAPPTHGGDCGQQRLSLTRIHHHRSGWINQVPRNSTAPMPPVRLLMLTDPYSGISMCFECR